MKRLHDGIVLNETVDSNTECMEIFPIRNMFGQLTPELSWETLTLPTSMGLSGSVTRHRLLCSMFLIGHFGVVEGTK